MGKKDLSVEVPDGIIISCQAESDSPLNEPPLLAALAASAERGGAVAVRADNPLNIAAIRRMISVPIIGIYKRDCSGSTVITPTEESAMEIIEAGALIIAFEIAAYSSDKDLLKLINSVHAAGAAIMADVAVLEEGRRAVAAGCDAVATTLSGYREASGYAQPNDPPDFELVRSLFDIAKGSAKVVAEGRYWTPQDIRHAFSMGAGAVVIGKAVTSPDAIVRRLISLSHT